MGCFASLCVSGNNDVPFQVAQAGGEPPGELARRYRTLKLDLFFVLLTGEEGTPTGDALAPDISVPDTEGGGYSNMVPVLFSRRLVPAIICQRRVELVILLKTPPGLRILSH